jgi:uncharacterized protein YutE (UPF0331/DUF86 family)
MIMTHALKKAVILILETVLMYTYANARMTLNARMETYAQMINALQAHAIIPITTIHAMIIMDAQIMTNAMMEPV